MEYRYSRADTRYDDECRVNEEGIKAPSDKSAEKRGSTHTRGSGIVFGFRRRPTSGIPLPITNYSTTDSPLLHQRSKSAGPDHTERRRDNDDNHQVYTSQSGRSTPRLAPPKKEASGIAVRTNRFGFRQPQSRYTNKVGDICSSHSVSHYNQEKQQQQLQSPQQQQESQHNNKLPGRAAIPKPRSSLVNNPQQRYYNDNLSKTESTTRKTSGIPEPVSRYTLHTSHLPLPQYAVRMTDSNTKVAKTVANQSRKVSTTSKVCTSSKEGSGTEDSGIGSNQGHPGEHDRALREYSEQASLSGRRGHSKPRNLRMVINGQSFDVRDVREDDSTVTEISVIMLPKPFVNPNMNTGLVRERTMQYQRVLNKDNRYTDSTTSMSTTSSEGYDEGLGEEKVYKDRSRSEKVATRKSDLSPPSSDDPEYGHGEAMADEYSLSSSDEYQRSLSEQHPKTSSNAAKNGNLRSVLLTIEDPAFAAVAATSTTLIDDETSPVDSLFDSPTASITQSEGKTSRKELGDTIDAMERSGNTIEDDGPGTPTNASNSLSLSEGREYFDDEIADQPGLIFDDASRTVALENPSGVANQSVTENSYTLVESHSKPNKPHGRSVENSPLHVRRISRAGSIDTLSPCESIASDDLMLDYERSDTSSYEESHQRMDSSAALHELDDATIISELEAQGEEVMRQWTSLLGTAQAQQQAANSNSVNNNVNSGISNNNQPTTESGISSGRTSKLLRSRSGTESPRSLDSVRIRQIPSPLRTPRSAQSPNLDSGDEGSVRIDREGYQSMFQDIVSIKTMLLKLKRVLQEADTLNPFDDATKNGLFYSLNEGGTIDVSTSPGENNIVDELSDLRRQVIFLQGQVEERDRTIQTLRFQMSKLRTSNDGDSRVASPTINRSISPEDTCNAATQTEKIRPVSAGPSILQSHPQDVNMGPLVSWSHRKPGEHSPLGSIRQNGHAEKSSPERPLCRRIPVPKEIASNKSSDANDISENEVKSESSTMKSKFPSGSRRLTTTTLIPRASRAVSVAGRSHNAL